MASAECGVKANETSRLAARHAALAARPEPASGYSTLFTFFRPNLLQKTGRQTIGSDFAAIRTFALHKSGRQNVKEPPAGLANRVH
jgi:hypothetical protein